MNPTVSDLHVNTPLTNLSVAYMQDPNEFVAWRMFPIVPVTKQGDKYYVFNQADFFRDDYQPRAPGAPAALSGYRLSEDSYYCERDALGVPVSDPERANADPAVSNLDDQAVQFLTQQMLVHDETDWVTTYFSTGLWTGASSTTDMAGSSTTPGSTATAFLQWNDVASTPIEDVAGEREAVHSRTGVYPNKLCLGSEVWTVLKNHPDIVDRIKYTQKGIVTKDLVAALLDVDEIMVSAGIKNTANEYATSTGGAGTYSNIAGKHALLAYVTPSPGLKVATAGYQFVWTAASGTPANGMGGRVKRYRDERHESDIIEMEKWRDYKLVAASLGAFFSSAVA